MKYLIGFLVTLLIFFWQKTCCNYFYLNAFAPLIGIYILSFKMEKVLWLALLIGFFIDLFTSTKIGVWSLNYCITAFILFRFKVNFYKDKTLHIAIFTSLFSSISTILHIFLSFLFDRSIPISGKWIITDCIVMPIVDGIYTILWYFSTVWLYESIKLKLSILRKRK